MRIMLIHVLLGDTVIGYCLQCKDTFNFYLIFHFAESYQKCGQGVDKCTVQPIYDEIPPSVSL